MHYEIEHKANGRWQCVGGKQDELSHAVFKRETLRKHLGGEYRVVAVERRVVDVGLLKEEA